MQQKTKYKSEYKSDWDYLRGLEPLSLCDWPGKACAVLFFADCDLRCPTCHNWKLAWEYDQLPIFGRQEILKFLHDRKKWLDGLVISGGEPSLRPDILKILKELTEFKLPIKLDSNGQRPQIIQEMLQQNLVQTFAIDVKGPWSKYPALTGNKVKPEQAQNNLESIFKLAKSYPEKFIFRCTKVPLLDDHDIEQVRRVLPMGHNLSVQNYIIPSQK